MAQPRNLMAIQTGNLMDSQKIWWYTTRQSGSPAVQWYTDGACCLVWWAQLSTWCNFLSWNWRSHKLFRTSPWQQAVIPFPHVSNQLWETGVLMGALCHQTRRKMGCCTNVFWENEPESENISSENSLSQYAACNPYCHSLSQAPPPWWVPVLQLGAKSLEMYRMPETVVGEPLATDIRK